MLFKLQKPDLSNIGNDDVGELLTSKKAGEVFEFINKLNKSDYLYWDKMQYKEPSPKGIPKELLWQMVKLFRTSKEKTPIVDISGNQFSWSRLDYLTVFSLL